MFRDIFKVLNRRRNSPDVKGIPRELESFEGWNCYAFGTGIYSYVLKRLDHGIGTLTRCEVVNIPHDAIQPLCEQYPNLAYALWRVP